MKIKIIIKYKLNMLYCCRVGKCQSHVPLSVLAQIQTHYVLAVIRAKADI